MNDVLSDVLTVDVSAGDVSSGDSVPALPTVPDMAGEALEWYSPAPDEEAVAETVPADGTEALQLLRSIDARLEGIFYISVALLIILGVLLGVELIKGFWLGRS